MTLRRLFAGMVIAGMVGAAALFGSVALAGDPGDRAAAEAALQEIDRDPNKTVTADSAKRARAALERAARLRAAGDEAHAKLAEGLAREWAEAGRDLARAVEAERKATEARAAALDAGSELERERALLEEGIARTGRLRAQIEAAEREARESGRTASPDAGGPKKNKPPNRPHAGGER